MKRHIWLILAIIILIAFGFSGIYACKNSIFGPQPEQTPTTAPQSTEFSNVSNVLAAYADDNFDNSSTPMELNRKTTQPVAAQLPRIKPAIFDDQGNFLATFEDSGQAILIGKFAVTSAAVASETSHPLPSGENLLPDWQGKNLKRGAILVFGVRPDGKQDYEILERSLGLDQSQLLELFERPKNSSYPYPSSLPYEIEDIANVKAGDRLVFYGYQKGGVSTLKQASVSAVDYQHSFFYFDGPLTTNDVGAPVFILKNGKQKLVGLAIGSFMRAGNETKAVAFGIKEVLKFIEEKTGSPVKISSSQVVPTEINPVLKEKLIRALSYNLYDLSFDLADLRNTGFKEVQQWIRPLEIVTKKADGGDREEILRHTAILIDRYAVIPVTPDNQAILEDWDSVKYKSKILWGGSVEGREDEPIAYEEAAFMGFGSQGGQKKVAVFLRFNDTKFPVPSGAPFVIGSSEKLTTGNALYALGFLDMSPMLFNFPHGDNDVLLYPDIHPAFFAGRGSGSTTFYFQGSIFSDDVGAPIFALRDGNLELVGITLGNVYGPKSEIFNAAISIETALEAVRQIACSDGSQGCVDATRGVSAVEPQSSGLAKITEAVQDAVLVFNILKEAGLEDSSLAMELLRPRLAVLQNNVNKIIVAFFDENGASLPTPTGPFSEGQATMLSPEYILTASTLLPNVINSAAPGVSGSVIGPDLSDLTSDTFPVGNKKITFRFAIARALLKPYEIIEGLTYIPFISEIFERNNDTTFLQNQAEIKEFLKKFKDLAIRYSYPELPASEYSYSGLINDLEQNSDNPVAFRQTLMDSDRQQFLNGMLKFYLSRMEVPEVVLVDRQTGYALLRRQMPPLGYYLSSFVDVSYKIGDSQSMQWGDRIYIAQSRDVALPYPALIPTVSNGVINGPLNPSAVFPVSGMIFQNSIGAPIFQISGGKPVFLGIIKSATIFPEIETDGSALPLQLILEKIKQKTGLDPLWVEPSPVLPIP